MKVFVGQWACFAWVPQALLLRSEDNVERSPARLVVFIIHISIIRLVNLIHLRLVCS